MMQIFLYLIPSLTKYSVEMKRIGCFYGIGIFLLLLFSRCSSDVVEEEVLPYAVLNLVRCLSNRPWIYREGVRGIFCC